MSSWIWIPLAYCGDVSFEALQCVRKQDIYMLPFGLPPSFGWALLFSRGLATGVTFQDIEFQFFSLLCCEALLASPYRVCALDSSLSACAQFINGLFLDLSGCRASMTFIRPSKPRKSTIVFIQLL